MPRAILAALLGFAAAAAGQEYSETFDDTPKGWILENKTTGAQWAFDATPAGFPSGPSRSGNSLNFNDGSGYAGCSCGAALSPGIDTAALTNPVLRFWCNYHTETRGPDFDRRHVEIYSVDGKTLHARWQLASVGYTFDRQGGLVGIGPGPCAEAHDDLETGAPASAWHEHRIYLDPAWGRVRVRFVFWSVDDQRNGYSGWAIDDLVVGSHPSPAPTGWPDVFPDTEANEVPNPDGAALDTCRRVDNRLVYQWASNNQGDTGVHLVIGDHPDSILGDSYMFYDPVHNHLHFSQYTEFGLWKQIAGEGFVKLRRGPKRSFCLTDSQRIGPATSVSPGCDAEYQAISYNYQDVYGLFTPGQEIDISGVAAMTDYWLIGTLDPFNRLRETDDSNQTDQIHFDLEFDNGQVTILDKDNPFPPSTAPLSITSVSEGLFRGLPSIHVLGSGFDTTLSPVVYGSDTEASEAPLYTIVDSDEIWVVLPAGLFEPASIDIVRATGDAVSARLGSVVPVACDPVPPPLAIVAVIVSPLSGTSELAPRTVTFDGSGNSDNGPLEHRWSFGDGSADFVVADVASGASTMPEHTFQDPGDYTVTFTVTDSDGRTDEQTVQVTASAAPAPPPPPPARSSSSCGVMGGEVPLLWALLLAARRRKRSRARRAATGE